MKWKKALLLMLMSILLLGGCEKKEVEKNKLITESTKINTKEENINVKGLISKEEAEKIAIEGFKEYLQMDMKKIKLPIKTQFVQKDEEYFYITADNIWRVCWVNEKDHIVYECEVNAQNGEILGFDNKNDFPDIDKNKDRRESIKACKKTVYEYIEKHKLLEGKKEVTLFDIEVHPVIMGITFRFRYDTDKFLDIVMDENKNKVSQFYNFQREEYNIKDEDVKIKKEEAKKLILDEIEKTFGEKIDTTNLVEDIKLVESKNIKAWFVYWYDIQGKEEYKEINYGGNLDANVGEIKFVTATNRDLNKKASPMNLEEAKKIAIDFINKNKLYDGIEKVEFIKEKSWDCISNFNIAFKYNEKEYMHIGIDTINKKVMVIGYTDDIREEKTKK